MTPQQPTSEQWGRRWGLWDQCDKCWFGKSGGPNIYTDQLLARAAATILTEQFGRLISARAFPPGPIRFKDEVDAPKSLESALKTLGIYE